MLAKGVLGSHWLLLLRFFPSALAPKQKAAEQSDFNRTTGHRTAAAVVPLKKDH